MNHNGTRSYQFKKIRKEAKTEKGAGEKYYGQMIIYFN
jgi:hypothetical protein